MPGQAQTFRLRSNCLISLEIWEGPEKF